MGVLEILGAIFIVGGCVFALTGSVGVLRLPDFYSRLHPAGKSDTLAQGLILIGLALFAGQQLIGSLTIEHAGADSHGGHGGDAWIGIANIIFKLVLLSGLLFLTAPTATHAIAKAARLDRHTKLAIETDPGASLVAEIAVPGDIKEPLEEEPGPELDVREGDEPEPSPEPSSKPSSKKEDD